MTNNIAIDVFIGLLAVFLLYSLLASILMEGLAKRLGLRQRTTFKAISKLLDDSKYSLCKPEMKNTVLTALFYTHPNIRNLGDDKINTKPSTISAQLFAETLIQILRGEQFTGTENQVAAIKLNLQLADQNRRGKLAIPDWYKHSSFDPLSLIETSGGKVLKQDFVDLDQLTLFQLEQFLLDSGSDIDLFKKKLVQWFNEMMDRAEGWYIKETRGYLFIIGLVIAVIFNVDAIYIAKQLANDKTMRDNMVSFASRLHADSLSKKTGMPVTSSDTALVKTFTEINKSYKESKQILGRGPACPDNCGMGWLLTAFAISLGAPFWFDLLGKLMCIRQGGNSGATKAQNKLDASQNNQQEAIG